jgi:hypothetical protein
MTTRARKELRMKRIHALRRIQARRYVQLLAIGVTALSGLALMAAPPASASTVSFIHETSGGQYYIGGPTINLYDPVKEIGSIGYNGIINKRISAGHYELEMNADTSKCVATADNGYLAVFHPCNGGSDVVWVESTGPDGHSTKFENPAGKFLAGDNQGDQFHVKDYGAPGWLYQFTFS